MIDIIEITDDIGVFDSDVPKAQNVLSVQLGTLDYAPDFGIDLVYFLSEDFQFQNDSFKAYLTQRLAESSINVSSLDITEDSLFSTYKFNLAPTAASDGLVR